MTDRNRSAHPDSDPSGDTDRRTDIEQAVDARADDVERMGSSVGTTSPTEPTVSPDAAGGSGGAVRNQDEDSQ